MATCVSDVAILCPQRSGVVLLAGVALVFVVLLLGDASARGAVLLPGVALVVWVVLSCIGVLVLFCSLVSRRLWRCLLSGVALVLAVVLLFGFVSVVGVVLLFGAPLCCSVVRRCLASMFWIGIKPVLLVVLPLGIVSVLGLVLLLGVWCRCVARWLAGARCAFVARCRASVFVVLLITGASVLGVGVVSALGVVR